MDRAVQDDAAAGDAPRQPRTLRLRPDGEMAYTDTDTNTDGVGEDVPTREIISIIDTHGNKETPRYVVARLQEEPSEAGESPYRLRLDGVDEVDEALLQAYGSGEAAPAFLAPGSDLHVVVSTKSGMGKALHVWEDVVRPLFRLLGGTPSDEGTEGPGYHVMITQTAQSVREFARSRWTARSRSTGGPRPSETILLLSGDGGVVDILNGSDETAALSTNGTEIEPGSSRPTLALLPLGTANALFHSLHKPIYGTSSKKDAQSTPPLPLTLALRTLIRGTPAPLPTFRATFSPGSRLVSYTPSTTDTIERHDTAVTHLHGAIVASYGFHAQLVWESDTPEYRKHGAARFGMLAASLLEESHAYRAEVRATPLLDGESELVLRNGEALPPTTPEAALGEANFNYVLATMVSNLEQTFTISPASRPLENDLRLVHFGDVGGERTMEIMTAAYADGAHVGMEGVGYEKVAGMRVKILESDPRWRKVCVDGTIVEIPQGGEMSVHRVGGALFNVLVPAGIYRDGQESN